MSWPVVVVFGLVWSLSRCGNVEEEDLDFSTLDVHDLSSNAYGTGKHTCLNLLNLKPEKGRYQLQIVTLTAILVIKMMR